jgi:hypothetical protein
MAEFFAGVDTNLIEGHKLEAVDQVLKMKNDRICEI